MNLAKTLKRISWLFLALAVTACKPVVLSPSGDVAAQQIGEAHVDSGRPDVTHDQEYSGSIRSNAVSSRWTAVRAA